MSVVRLNPQQAGMENPSFGILRKDRRSPYRSAGSNQQVAGEGLKAGQLPEFLLSDEILAGIEVAINDATLIVDLDRP